MPSTIYTTNSAAQTQRLGSQLARQFAGNEVIALQGNLGSGKTQLVKGFARGLGITTAVTSPTFVLMKDYPFSHPRTKKPMVLHHLDLYRTNDLGALGIGFDELRHPGSVVVIEWSENLGAFLPRDATIITISPGKNDSDRLITVEQNQR